MKKFIVEKEFWNIFSGAKTDVVVFYGIGNNIKKGVK